MRNSIILLVIGFIFQGCSGSNDSSGMRDKAVLSLAKEWYKGGTLHKAQINEWKSATAKNKLATCADFMATVDNSVSMEVLKNRAENLKLCIDEATKDMEQTNSDAVATIAALCIKQMGY